MDHPLLLYIINCTTICLIKYNYELDVLSSARAKNKKLIKVYLKLKAIIFICNVLINHSYLISPNNISSFE